MYGLTVGVWGDSTAPNELGAAGGSFYAEMLCDTAMLPPMAHHVITVFAITKQPHIS